MQEGSPGKGNRCPEFGKLDYVVDGGKGNMHSPHPSSYIDRLGPTIGNFLTGLQELTGWSFCVLMGGPMPDADLRGKNDTYSVYIGMTNLEYTFDQVNPNFVTDIRVMRPFKSFLDQVPGKSGCRT